MDLLERLKADQLTARKNRNTVDANVLGLVVAECATKSKNFNPPRALTDDEVLGVVQSVLKRIGEALRLTQGQSDRQQERTKLIQERKVLETYLPARLSDEEITEIAVRQHSLDQKVGQIMAYLKTSYAGRYDPTKAFAIIKDVVGGT